MEFDTVVGNPPYQIMDGGQGGSSLPVYQYFVKTAKSLKPDYLSLVIPARWYNAGRGLDSFRVDMLSDTTIRVLHDFTKTSDCFYSGVEIKGGVCYFLCDRHHTGKCIVYTHEGFVVKQQESRYLKEEKSDSFIRYPEGISIYHKVKAFGEHTMNHYVSAQRPFGLRTYVHGKREPFEGAVKMYERGRVGYVNADKITQHQEWIDMPKIYISAAYGASDTFPHQILGKPICGERNSCCTETYVVIGPYSDETTTVIVKNYIQTKFFRFLVMLNKISQHAAANVYSFVPVQDFSRPWTDAELYAKYQLSEEEIQFIEDMIKPME